MFFINKQNRINKKTLKGLNAFLILWGTQAFSSLGSSMTNFAFIIWSYERQGSALTTALLAVCSYAPYVLLSIFAGALSARWDKKKTMLVCDTLAALMTLIVWSLLKGGRLEIWHLYLINAVNGMANSVQQPASEVAVSLLTPKEQYQRIGGLKAFSNSLVTILTPMIATAVLAFAGMDAVILFDFMSFGTAFISLAFFIRIPKVEKEKGEKRESFLKSAGEGLHFLQENRGILGLILFLSAVNLIASVYEAALPAMLLSRAGGGKTALGALNTFTGFASLVGSIFASALPAPKNRVRVICNSLMFSMCTENFFLAFGRSMPVWCFGAVLGWLMIPLMNANLDVLLRIHIPVEMQGRVYSVRNSLQFFTIPVGYLLGGALVDRVFEPFMSLQGPDSVFTALFGTGKGSGAALLYAILGAAGVLTCLYFRKNRHIRELAKKSV